MKDLSVLFAVETSSRDDCSAVRRLLVLKEGLDNFGVRTGILYMGDYFLSSPRLLLPLLTPRFLRVVKNYKFVHAAGMAAYAMGFAKSFGSFKLIYDVHGSVQEASLLRRNMFDLVGNYSLLVSMIAPSVPMKRSDYFITVSEPLRRSLIRQGIDPQRIEIIYNSVDTELFKPSEDRRENKMFTVTYAGAFQKWQGIENLVEAAYLLKDAEVKFKMIGFRETDYAFREEIRRRLKDEADLIDFLPNQPPALIDHLRNSDILIIPRLWVPGTSKYSNIQLLRETFGWFPTKFAEYIATGRPVIVTSLDVSAELVGRYDCGFVCDPAPAAIAQTILQARDTPKESLDEKGMNGRRLAEAEFDLKVTGKKYFEFLSGIA